MRNFFRVKSVRTNLFVYGQLQLRYDSDYNINPKGCYSFFYDRNLFIFVVRLRLMVFVFVYVR